MAYIVKPAVYENLKLSGLGLISNDSIRSKLVIHYDHLTPYLVEVKRSFYLVFKSLIVEPTMVKKFDYAWFLKPAFPNTYCKLKKDVEYLSLLKTNKEIKDFQLRRTKEVLLSAYYLQNVIGEFIKRGQFCLMYSSYAFDTIVNYGQAMFKSHYLLDKRPSIN